MPQQDQSSRQSVVDQIRNSDSFRKVNTWVEDFIGKFIDDKGNFVENQPGDFKNFIANIQSGGVSGGPKNPNVDDTMLKPFLDYATSKGYNVGSDYSLSKTSSSGQPGSYTPATPKGPDQTIPTNPSPSDVPGQTIPGPNIDLNSDRGQIEQEAAREKQQTLNAVNQAADLRTKGIGSLGDILLRHNQAQFNYDLPGIKEDLANSGLFSSPSALAAAVARESGMLGANSQSALAQAGLGNIDLQAEGLLGATQSQTQLQQGALQRQFSVSDYEKQAALARQIGATSVPSSPNFSILGGLGAGAATYGSTFGLGQTAAQAAAGTAGPYALPLALVAGAAGSAKTGGNSFLCTQLKKMDLMTEDEVKLVHDKIFTKKFRHYYSFFAYCVIAPIFIARVNFVDYPWQDFKKSLCDDILACETSEEAFQKYKEAALRMMRPILPGLCNFFFGKEKVYGY